MREVNFRLQSLLGTTMTGELLAVVIGDGANNFSNRTQNLQRGLVDLSSRLALDEYRESHS